MRRRLRRLILWTSLTAAALLLVLWVVSGWYVLEIGAPGALVSIEPGGSWVIWIWPPEFDLLSWDYEITEMTSAQGPQRWWFDGSTLPWLDGTFKTRWVFIPFWFLILLTAAPAAWILFRDRRRLPPGHCTKCRYDLRDSGSQSAVCPECGSAVTAARD